MFKSFVENKNVLNILKKTLARIPKEGFYKFKYLFI